MITHCAREGCFARSATEKIRAKAAVQGAELVEIIVEAVMEKMTWQLPEYLDPSRSPGCSTTQWKSARCP
jgi:hypothetical protein